MSAALLLGQNGARHDGEVRARDRCDEAEGALHEPIGPFPTLSLPQLSGTHSQSINQSINQLSNQSIYESIDR